MATVSPKRLLSVIETTLLGRDAPTPSQKIEFLHAIRDSLPSLRELLSYPPPKPSDRAEVQSKQVRLPHIGPITLDDQDVQIALKLSDDLHLNEIDCVSFLISANQEWGLLGREPLEVFRLAAGLWYTERRDLLTAVYTLLRAVVLDQGLDVDLLAEVQSYVEDLITSGMRERLILMIKELCREDSTGVGGPNSEKYILDSRCALVERKAVISRERLTIGHSLVLSNLIERLGTKDVKDLFFALKDSLADYNGTTDFVNQQITYSLLFSLVIAFISDALGAVSDKSPILSHDALFRREFHEILMLDVNDPVVGGFVNCVRLAWVVHLILVLDGSDGGEMISSALPDDMRTVHSCLEAFFENNVFQFFLDKILLSAGFKNDDEDMVYVYYAYLHKQMSFFLSSPVARDKVKGAKEKAMNIPSPYYAAGIIGHLNEGGGHLRETPDSGIEPFISLLEFVGEIYKNEPELLSGNDVIWTFVKFAGEDHTNFRTLVAFLNMLSALACNQEGALKVFELLQGKVFASISWTTMFDCLSIYEERNKQAMQISGALLPEFQHGDAKALLAYVNVLKKVMENGSPHQRKNWFPDIEPLFKLLSYENVPPYLKGALRDAISCFVNVSPVMKDTIWRYLEQYDLPVVVRPNDGYTGQLIDTQVYDMRFELNEIEAQTEQYPSSISFINLVNILIAEERDFSDRGRRFIGIFRFIYDYIFGPFPQRGYADASEKWQLIVGCLKHFQMMLSMYNVLEDDIGTASGHSQISMVDQSLQTSMQLPVVEIMKDFMSGKSLFRNVLSVLLPGVNSLIIDRANQIYGQLIEKAVLLSMEIIFLVMEKDSTVSDLWRPLYQPLDVILSQDPNQIVTLMEYIRYDFDPQIQLYSIKIMKILSERMDGLPALLLKSNYASALAEDYAAYLQLRSEECQIIEDSSMDSGALIMQLLIENISRPAPNITHLLLKFDVDGPVERTILQPKFHYSCLKVLLDILDKLAKPDVNAVLHEFGFQLLYELCVNPLTSSPTMDLLSTKKYYFFAKHLDFLCATPFLKSDSNQILRISFLHQRAWLLKILSFELHSADMEDANHRNACRYILTELFGGRQVENGIDDLYSTPENVFNAAATGVIRRNKILELLDAICYKGADGVLKMSQLVTSLKYLSMAQDVLSNSTDLEVGVYYISERGDRLIDLASFRERLWQKCGQLNSLVVEAELNEARNAIQQLLRWGWKYNKNLEEQAAQLHMLTSWSQIVEICISQKASFLENTYEIIFQLLDSTLDASGSPECALKIAQILTQVGLTCMAKLRNDRFSFLKESTPDTVNGFDMIMTRKMPNGACHSILFKLIVAVLRHDSSEALRKRQYAVLLSYFQYCRHLLDSDVSVMILQFFSVEELDEDLDLDKVDKDQCELENLNFAIVRKECQPFLDKVIKDATQGSEMIKTMSLYVLDTLICIDREKFFFCQLQSRGFLRTFFASISNYAYEDGGHSITSMQHLFTLEAELSLLLRISHKYGKSGLQVLMSMGSLQHISSCKALSLPVKGKFQRFGPRAGKNSVDVDRKRLVAAPILRYLFSLTSLVDASEFLEMKNKVAREVIEFIRGHQTLFDQILQEDPLDADVLTLELVFLVVSLISKVWPYEESDDYGFIQRIFVMIRSVFSHQPEIFSPSALQSEIKREAGLSLTRLCVSLSSYLHSLVTMKSLMLPVTDLPTDYNAPTASQRPTLFSLVLFLGYLANALETTTEEKFLLLNKIKDITEFSRQEVDQIIELYVHKEYTTSSESIKKRRSVAMIGICRAAGHANQLITYLLLIAQNIMNIILVHFQDSEIINGVDDHALLGELNLILDKFELVNEDKVGQSLKIFFRLARSLKEMTVKKLAA